MANAFSIVRIVLLVFLIIVLVVTLVYFVRAVVDIGKNRNRDSNVKTAINIALIACNTILGLVGAYRIHFLFTLIFAIIQTVLILLGVFLLDELWFAIPCVGSAVLAFIFVVLIKQGHTVG